MAWMCDRLLQVITGCRTYKILTIDNCKNHQLLWRSQVRKGIGIQLLLLNSLRFGQIRCLINQDNSHYFSGSLDEHWALQIRRGTLLSPKLIFFFSKQFWAWASSLHSYTAVSSKVVGESARDNLERYCGWFLVHCFSKKFQRMARKVMDVCLRGLKESNKSRFDSYILIISQITFRDCRVHSFCDNLSRNSCIPQTLF